MKITHKLLFVLTILLSTLFSPAIKAQMVSTFANAPSNADVAVDSEGNVYVASESSQITRILSDGTVESPPFASGGLFNRAGGLCFDNTGTNLYVTNRPLTSAGWITKVAPNGNSEIFASNLPFPGDISFDDTGNMYVTQFNNNVQKITPEGEVNLYVNTPVFNTALGIAWTPGDTIFVSSAHDGNIYKLSPGNPVQVAFFAHVDGLQQNWACGFMTYQNGKLYITNGDNKIHSIDRNGVVSDFAGNGDPGGTDGIVDVAQFNAPNGIGFNNDGTKLYIGEYNQNRIREIADFPIGIEEEHLQHSFQVYPNPFNKVVIFEFDLEEASRAIILIYNAKGQLVKKLASDIPAAGKQQVIWEPGNENIPEGAYFGILKNGNTAHSFRVIHHNR